MYDCHSRQFSRNSTSTSWKSDISFNRWCYVTHRRTWPPRKAFFLLRKERLISKERISPPQWNSFRPCVQWTYSVRGLCELHLQCPRSMWVTLTVSEVYVRCTYSVRGLCEVHLQCPRSMWVALTVSGGLCAVHLQCPAVCVQCTYSVRRAFSEPWTSVT